jgi:hypothetical protein
MTSASWSLGAVNLLLVGHWAGAAWQLPQQQGSGCQKDQEPSPATAWKMARQSMPWQ